MWRQSLLLLVLFATPALSILLSAKNVIPCDFNRGDGPLLSTRPDESGRVSNSGALLTHGQGIPCQRNALRLCSYYIQGDSATEFGERHDVCSSRMRLRGAGDVGAVGSKMVEIALQAERSGVDLASVLKNNSVSSSNTTAPSPGRKDAKARELGQVQLEACQMVMDDCYDNGIRPLVEELENKIFAGDGGTAEQGGFAPYKRFSKDGAELISNCRVVIDKAVKQLQAQLEVIQFASVNGGRPVSSVEFEKLKVDMRPVRHLVSEAFRELHATADRNLERLWIQHKAVIRDCYIDRFEQSFEKLIAGCPFLCPDASETASDGDLAGSSNFNRTTKALTRKTYRECEDEIKSAVPRGLGPGRTVQLEYSQDMEELKHALMAAISSRRRQSGLDDLMSYFNNIADERRPFSRLWWKNIAIRGLVMYYQICQSAWAYRKARGIPYPRRFSKPWLAAVLLPWRFAPGERDGEKKKKDAR